MFALRHQSRGIDARFIYVERPTEAQIAAVRAEYGPGWIVVVPVAVLGPDDVPDVAAHAPGPRDSIASIGEVSVSGTGTVTNRSG